MDVHLIKSPSRGNWEGGETKPIPRWKVYGDAGILMKVIGESVTTGDDFRTGFFLISGFFTSGFLTCWLAGNRSCQIEKNLSFLRPVRLRSSVPPKPRDWLLTCWNLKRKEIVTSPKYFHHRHFFQRHPLYHNFFWPTSKLFAHINKTCFKKFHGCRKDLLFAQKK
jgi:hypothetical protein